MAKKNFIRLLAAVLALMLFSPCVLADAGERLAVERQVFDYLTQELKLCIGGNKIYTTVSNQGNTIPPEELPLVFDRFHKIDKARNRSQEGWGLGLYIVKTLVCSHGENISVASRDGKTEFTFTKPLVN